MSIDVAKFVSDIKSEISDNTNSIDPNKLAGITEKTSATVNSFNPNKLSETSVSAKIEVKEKKEDIQNKEKSKVDIERYIECRNKSLKNERHPITGIPFVEKTITKSDGEKITGVFAQFESKFDAQLPKELYTETDKKQFAECNKQLKDNIKENPSLREKFDEEQLDQIENGETPDGYVWHHNEEEGKMRLVDFETHQSTGHTGGKAVWGEGNR